MIFTSKPLYLDYKWKYASDCHGYKDTYMNLSKNNSTAITKSKVIRLSSDWSLMFKGTFKVKEAN